MWNFVIVEFMGVKNNCLGTFRLKYWRHCIVTWQKYVEKSKVSFCNEAIGKDIDRKLLYVKFSQTVDSKIVEHTDFMKSYIYVCSTLLWFDSFLCRLHCKVRER